MSRPFTLRSNRQSPEAVLQRRVVTFLRAYLPDEVWWTASLSGVKLTMQIAVQAKAAGMNKGAPDLSFVWPDGSTTYIELKAAGGTLTPEQRQLWDTLGDRMTVCRTWPEVRTSLHVWMQRHGLTWLSDADAWKREKSRRAA